MNPTDARDTIVKEIAIKVPADRIFEALTNPEQRLKWWAPKGNTEERTWSPTCDPAVNG